MSGAVRWKSGAEKPISGTAAAISNVVRLISDGPTAKSDHQNLKSALNTPISALQKKTSFYTRPISRFTAVKVGERQPISAKQIRSSPKTKTPRDPKLGRGVLKKWGWECATLSSPVTGLRRSARKRAASSPTLFATASGICGLAAGPAGRLPRTAIRVRPLSPVRQAPAGA